MNETVDVYKALPNSQLAILPNTAHHIEKLNVELVTAVVREFI